MIFRRFAQSFVLIAAACAVGCGGSGGVNIKGSVNLDSGEAIEKGVVNIVSPAGSYRGNIMTDGTYSIDAVPKGTYKVAVTGTGEDAPVMKRQEDGTFSMEKKKALARAIAPKFEDSEKSGLQITVPGEYGIKVTAK